jgi:hypothetical protein
MLAELTDRGFECAFFCHAGAILEGDFPGAVEDISSVLGTFDVPITEIVGSGGGETKGTQRMRKAFAGAGWNKKCYEIRKIINGIERESISHEVDHVKVFQNGEVALEIEWNNKDPFFDRDLENFKRLHAEGAISLGVIVTRGTTLHSSMEEFVRRFAIEQAIGSFLDLDRLNLDLTGPKRRAITKQITRKKNPIPFHHAWVHNFVKNKYGEATTHWKKLMERVHRGVGNPCPLLLIGLPASIVTFPTGPSEAMAAAIEAASIENSEDVPEE